MTWHFFYHCHPRLLHLVHHLHPWSMTIQLSNSSMHNWMLNLLRWRNHRHRPKLNNNINQQIIIITIKKRNRFDDDHFLVRFDRFSSFRSHWKTYRLIWFRSGLMLSRSFVELAIQMNRKMSFTLKCERNLYLNILIAQMLNSIVSSCSCCHCSPHSRLFSTSTLRSDGLWRMVFDWIRSRCLYWSDPWIR